MTPDEQLQSHMSDLRNIIKNFRIRGSGVSGSFEKGYNVQPSEGYFGSGTMPRGGSSTPPSPPLPTTGACCFTDEFGVGCYETTGDDCATSGGTYLGDGSLCTPFPCAYPCFVTCPPIQLDINGTWTINRTCPNTGNIVSLFTTTTKTFIISGCCGINGGPDASWSKPEPFHKCAINRGNTCVQGLEWTEPLTYSCCDSGGGSGVSTWQLGFYQFADDTWNLIFYAGGNVCTWGWSSPGYDGPLPPNPPDGIYPFNVTTSDGHHFTGSITITTLSPHP